MVRHQAGFTLLESMIAMGVLALMLSLAVPSMVDLRSQSRVDTVHRDLISAMNQARSMAVSQSERISLCGSSNGQNCDGTWNQWLLFVGTLPAASTAVVPIQTGNLGGLAVNATQTGTTWQSTGEVSQSMTLSLCPDQVAHQRQVSLSLIGRARGSVDIDRDGSHNLPTGACP